MQRRAFWFARLAALTAIPLAFTWANPTPPVSRTGAPGDTTCTSCHGGAGSGSVVVTSTSGMTTYAPGASKRFTVTVSGSGNAGFELTARPASNLSGGVAGNLVAGAGMQVLCRAGTTCAAGNPQYIRSTSAAASPRAYTFDWTAPSGTENVTIYVAAAVGYRGNTYTASYTLSPSGGGTTPTLSVTPGTLSFSYRVGGTAPAAQTLAISGAATTYTAAASGGTWLSVSPTSGGASGSASVSVNPAGLAAGAYNGSVTVTAAGSSGSPKTVPVTLTVTPATPTLTVSPTSLTFDYRVGGAAPAAQTLAISGAATTYTAAASGGTWLRVSPASGGASGSASVSVNPAGLAAGAYNGSVTITAAGTTGSPKTVPVTLNVTQGPPTLSASPTSLTFTYQTGGTAPAAQTLAISGAATTYTAAASGGSWLSVSPATGGASGTANVSVNTAGLAAGSYSGSITITAAGSTGTPKTVPVSLTVTSNSPSLTVTPETLSFNCATGDKGPIPLVINVASSAELSYTAAASGGSWLSVAPARGATPGAVFVSVNPAQLSAGTYRGAIAITYTGSPSSTRTVPVTLAVSAGTNACQVPDTDDHD